VYFYHTSVWLSAVVLPQSNFPEPTQIPRPFPHFGPFFQTFHRPQPNSLTFPGFQKSGTVTLEKWLYVYLVSFIIQHTLLARAKLIKHFWLKTINTATTLTSNDSNNYFRNDLLTHTLFHDRQTGTFAGYKQLQHMTATKTPAKLNCNLFSSV